MPDPKTQLEDFALAVELLGGQRATARELGIHERSVRALLAGPEAPHGRALHDGFLRNIAKALLAHAAACRSAERRLSPAFAANLTPDQAAANPADGRRYDRQLKWVRDTDLVCKTCRWRAGHSPDCPLKDNPWPMTEVPI